MKKRYFVFGIFAFILWLAVSCSKTDEDYSDFLSDQEGKYSLYIAADEEDINNVKTILQDRSITEARFDEIKELSSFILFGTKDKVFKTNSKTKLINFLLDNN